MHMVKLPGASPPGLLSIDVLHCCTFFAERNSTAMQTAHKASVFIATIAILGLAAAHPAQAQYTFTTIDDPSTPGATTVTAVNDAGVVLGPDYTYTQGGGFSPLPLVPDGVAGEIARGINDSGQIVGQYADSTHVSHAFLYTPGSGYANLDDPAAKAETRASGINNAGQVIGGYADLPGTTNTHGFVYTPGTGPGAGFKTFDGPGASLTFLYGINDSGQIAGVYQGINDRYGFVYTPGQGFVNVPDAPGSISSTTDPFAINASGQTVGVYADPGVFDHHGFVYTASGGFTEFDDPFAEAGMGGTFAEGINSSGEIVGFSYDSTGEHGFIATPAAVPEASSLVSLSVLLLLGAGGMGAAARKRMKAAV